MKVKELKKLLENVDDDRIVIMSIDGEGNGFSPLSDLSDKSVYAAESVSLGTIGLEKLTSELEEKGYTSEDVGEGEKALVLWPTN